MRKRIGLCGILAAFAVSAVQAADVDGFSAPSADVTLSFVRSGLVTKVLAKEGTLVSADDVLVHLDDSIETAKIHQLEAEFKNDVRRRSELAKLDQKRIDFQNLEKATSVGASSIKEIDTARLEVKELEFSVEMLLFEKRQLEMKIAEEKILQSQTTLISPLDGIVEKVHVERGESVERLGECVRIVRIDPLWIEINVPLEQSAGLAVGAVCDVVFPKTAAYKKETRRGKVIFRSSVADPGSETLKFRLEVANPSLRIAGERVSMVIP